MGSPATDGDRKGKADSSLRDGASRRSGTQKKMRPPLRLRMTAPFDGVFLRGLGVNVAPRTLFTRAASTARTRARHPGLVPEGARENWRKPSASQETQPDWAKSSGPALTARGRAQREDPSYSRKVRTLGDNVTLLLKFGTFCCGACAWSFPGQRACRAWRPRRRHFCAPLRGSRSLTASDSPRSLVPFRLRSARR